MKKKNKQKKKQKKKHISKCLLLKFLPSMPSANLSIIQQWFLYWSVCGRWPNPNVMWAAPSEKVPSSMRKMGGFTSCCTCAKSHPGICSPLKHSIVSKDSVCGQWRPWSDCAYAQADLGLRCPHFTEGKFRMARPIYKQMQMWHATSHILLP